MTTKTFQLGTTVTYTATYKGAQSRKGTLLALGTNGAALVAFPLPMSMTLVRTLHTSELA